MQNAYPGSDLGEGAQLTRKLYCWSIDYPIWCIVGLKGGTKLQQFVPFQSHSASEKDNQWSLITLFQ